MYGFDPSFILYSLAGEWWWWEKKNGKCRIYRVLDIRERGNAWVCFVFLSFFFFCFSVFLWPGINYGFILSFFFLLSPILYSAMSPVRFLYCLLPFLSSFLLSHPDQLYLLYTTKYMNKYSWSGYKNTSCSSLRTKVEFQARNSGNLYTPSWYGNLFASNSLKLTHHR